MKEKVNHCDRCKAGRNAEEYGWFCDIYGMDSEKIKDCDLSDEMVTFILEQKDEARQEERELIIATLSCRSYEQDKRSTIVQLSGEKEPDLNE